MDSSRYLASPLKVPPDDSPLPSLLLRVVDLGLISMLFFAPLFMGGRHPVGRLVLVSIVAIMGTAWFLRQCLLQRAVWRSTAGQWIFLAACCLVFLQVLPLSSEWTTALSPSNAKLLPLWSQEGQSAIHFGNWNYLSLNPQLTIYGLSVLFAYGITFLVTVQRVETLADVQLILKWIAFATIALALLGLAQYVSTGDKFLWTYEHPFRKADRIQGPFINPNHFCHLLALGVGACTGWMVLRIKQPSSDQTAFGNRNKRKSHHRNEILTYVACIGTGVVVFTGLLSMSRGGMLALIIALSIVTLVYVCKKILDRRYLYGAIGAVVVGSILFAIHGGDEIAREIDSLKTLSVNSADYKQMRQAIWGANVQAIEARPWFGHGVGTHRDFYKTYLDKPFPVEFSHAESGYMQVGSEAGVVGLGLLMASFMVCGFWCLGALWNNKNLVEIICGGAVTSALVASAFHSVVDFVWYIPACMSWTVILCGLACRLYQLRSASENQPSFALPRVVWMGVVIVVAILCLGSVQVLVRPARASQHWDKYQLYAKERVRLERQTAALFKHLEKQKEIMRLSAGLDKKMEAELLAYSAKDIDNAKVHLRIAAIYLRQFQSEQRSSINPMDIGQIRDAAIASQFPSTEALNAWLGRAIGEHRELLYRALWHARQAAMRCPLQGEAYIFLAELSFLEGSDQSVKVALVEQAICVRPYDAKVLLMAGKEAAIAGEVEAAVEHWRKSFKYSVDGKWEVVQLLSQRIPANITMQILEPAANDLNLFSRAYQSLGDPVQVEEVCKFFEQLLWQANKENQIVLPLWMTLSRAYKQIEKNDKALVCARQACKCDVNAYEARLLMASVLFELSAYSEAEQHLRWCVSRRPEHEPARSLLKKIVMKKMSQATPTAISPNGTATRR